MSVTIKTDRKWREFLYRYQVPEKVLESEFDHLPEAYDGFFKYRQWWFHVSDFLRIPPDENDLKGWHGYNPDGFFSGVLIRVSDDGEAFQVGTYLT